MSIKDRIRKTAVYKRWNAYRWRERLTHPGQEFPDRTFYVIRRHANRAGLLSFLSTNLAAAEAAAAKGYIPVIDMQNSPNPMLREDEVGKKNAWEDYFLQPAGYGLDDIRNAANVILGSIDPPREFPDAKMFRNKELLTRWKKDADAYLHLQPAIEKAAEDYRREVIGDRRVLGVLARGTDYVRLRPKNHPVQPTAQQVIAKAKETMERLDCELIYLATEDADIWDAFEKAFPGRVVSYQKNRYRTKEGEVINDVVNKNADPRERNTEYLTSIAVLSGCCGLVAGAANGTYGAYLLSGGYEELYVFDLGVY